MDERQRVSLTGGILLILLGAGFLAVQLVPGLAERINVTLSWPLIVIGVGVLLLVIGLLTGSPGMAVPAAIVGGIGGLLYWQNTTGNWESWAYAWTLIPGFVGVGTLLMGLFSGERRQIRDGLGGILVSAVLFLIFSSFLGGPNLLGPYWPVLLIGLGVWLLVRRLVRAS